jgi:flagellar L-ring protein precursor FlgH
MNAPRFNPPRLTGLTRVLRLAAGLGLAGLALPGCQTVYPLPPVDFPTATAPAIPASGPLAMPELQPVPQAAAQAPTAPTGGIWQSAAYRPMFEDHRARLVGDTLTVQITEQISATQKSTSTLDKKSALEGSLTAVPLFSANSFNRAGVAGSTNNTFEGKGTSENTNTFSGTINAIVIGVLPNGHLLIAGEKQIGVNHNVDVLRFTGQVDPRAIQPGNSVTSTQVANVRIEQRGRGAQADAQGIGWLARFFLNLSPI